MHHTVFGNESGPKTIQDNQWGWKRYYGDACSREFIRSKLIDIDCKILGHPMHISWTREFTISKLKDIDFKIIGHPCIYILDTFSKGLDQVHKHRKEGDRITEKTTIHAKHDIEECRQRMKINGIQNHGDTWM
nr:hypothetical protein Iba_scaffold2458CG0040 [Ipomoea batatas]GME18597.1 hypothetical protein Iba_scaffold21011CG0010 [Ipomoea batatas]